MKKILLFTILITTALLVSCSKTAIHEEQGQKQTVGSRTIIFPSEFSLNAVSNSKSHYAYGKESAQRASSRATVSYNDIAGVLAERSLETGEETPADILATIVSRLNNAPYSETGYWADLRGLTSLSRISNYDLTESYSAVIGSYNLTTTTSFTVTEIANGLSQAFSYTTANGIPEETLPENSANEPSDTEFRVYIVAFYIEGTPDTAFVNALVVRESAYENYVTEANRSVSPSNVTSSSAKYTSTKNSFTMKATSNKADFLFVIDNSGSMSDEQTAIAQVATDFDNTIQNSGLDYRMATVTTDSSTLRDTENDGGITTSLTEFTNDLQPGTSGSASESGIYHAEEALLSIALGDSSDGSLTSEVEPMPRAGTSLNIIIMSDEPDQYSSYGSTTFDLANNLFLDRGYIVHAIVGPYSGTEYTELATATGGLEGDITNLTSFNQIIVDISTIAGASASRFELDEFPVSETIVVYKNGNLVPRSSNNGWTNPVGSKKIVFNGTYLPAEGDVIRVEYIYASAS